MATLNILYEDPHILVCVKPHGIATQNKSIRYPDMVSLIKNHLAKSSGSRNPGSAEPYLAVIHRLDQPVAGILVFAKTPAAAKDMNKQLQNQGFGKYYRALVANTPSTKEGTLENYMVKDARTNTSRICSAKENGSKIARLHYDTVPDHGRYRAVCNGHCHDQPRGRQSIAAGPDGPGDAADRRPVRWPAVVAGSQPGARSAAGQCPVA